MGSNQAPDTSTEQPALGQDGAPTSRRPLLRRLLQSIALIVVAGLLALLVWRVVHSGSGSAVVRAVARGEKPLAPGFDLSVIWRHPETWPPSLRKTLSDGR